MHEETGYVWFWQKAEVRELPINVRFQSIGRSLCSSTSDRVGPIPFGGGWSSGIFTRARHTHHAVIQTIGSGILARDEHPYGRYTHDRCRDPAEDRDRSSCRESTHYRFFRGQQDDHDH